MSSCQKGGNPLTYYDREVRFQNGAPVITTPEDIENEKLVAKELQAAWDCELYHMGRNSFIDWRAYRGDELYAWVELKSRSHASDKYPTVWLNWRKYLSMTFASLAFNKQSIFVVKFTDCIKWIHVHAVDPTKVRIGGCVRFVKSLSDVEPVIDVPVQDMYSLDSSATLDPAA